MISNTRCQSDHILASDVDRLQNDACLEHLGLEGGYRSLDKGLGHSKWTDARTLRIAEHLIEEETGLLGLFPKLDFHLSPLEASQEATRHLLQDDCLLVVDTLLFVQLLDLPVLKEHLLSCQAIARQKLLSNLCSSHEPAFNSRDVKDLGASATGWRRAVGWAIRQ